MNTTEMVLDLDELIEEIDLDMAMRLWIVPENRHPWRS